GALSAELIGEWDINGMICRNPLARLPMAAGTVRSPCTTVPWPRQPSQRGVNNYLRPYGQVGELLRMLRSLRMNVVSGWRRLIVAEPVFNGAIEQRSNEADSTRVSSRNFVMQPTRVTTPRPVITNPSTPQRTNL